MRIELDADRLAALKRDYEADAEPLKVLAARFSISPATLRRIAADMAFTPRPPARPFTRKGAAPAAKRSGRGKRGGKPAPAPLAAAPAPASPGPALKPLDLGAMAHRVQASVERELGKIHDELEAGADVERRARTLASLVKTLGDLARLEEARAGGKPAAAGADEGAWNIDDLRAEVARRLDRLAKSEPG